MWIFCYNRNWWYCPLQKITVIIFLNTNLFCVFLDAIGYIFTRAFLRMGWLYNEIGWLTQKEEESRNNNSIMNTLALLLLVFR